MPIVLYDTENGVSTFSWLFSIQSFLYFQVIGTCIKACFLVTIYLILFDNPYNEDIHNILDEFILISTRLDHDCGVSNT